MSLSSPEIPTHHPAEAERSHGGRAFPATQWSAILPDGGAGGSQASLQELAVRYWRPLYLYLRKRGECHDDACDTVQGFFEFILSSDFIDHLEKEGGRFRSYLLASLERWRTRRRTFAGAQKRGGNVVHVPLESFDEMEQVENLADGISPEAAYDRQWAAAMVARAVDALSRQYAGRGRAAWFDALRPALPGGGGLPEYAELAAALGCTEGAVRKAVFDLRSSFAAGLREEIRATVRNPEDAEEELRHLIRSFTG